MKNHSLFEKYRSVIVSFRDVKDRKDLLLEDSGEERIYYAPFDYVNPEARLFNEYTEYSVPKNFSVDAEFHCSQGQTCCKNGNTGIGVGNQVKGRIDRDRKLDP